MTARPTIYEVARRCDVSTATVSRVMSDGDGFSEATRKRVLAAAAELGWSPNASARGLAGRSAGIVGLLFPDLGKAADDESESPLFVDQVIRGAERAATLAGSAVLLAAARGRGGRELVRSVVAKVDGLVVVARALPARELREISAVLPVVVLTPRESRGRLDFVTADNRAATRDLVAHLTVRHRHRRLAFVAGPRVSPDSTERFLGYQDGLRDAGIDVPDAPDEHGGFTERGGHDAVIRLVENRLSRRAKLPEAIVCGNDEMAIGALTALRRQGVRVPLDVAITGFDDISAARLVRPALTTVRQPMRDIGEQAVRVLLERIEDASAPRRTLALPTETVPRRSCGCQSRTRNRTTTMRTAA